jgi:hypothetical protein
MERSGGTEIENIRNEKEDAETEISIYTDRHNQFSVNIRKSKSMERNGRAGNRNNRNEKENA